MDEQNIKNKALGELVSLNKLGIIAILKKYGISPKSNSNIDVSTSLVEGMRNEALTSEIVLLMKSMVGSEKMYNSKGDDDDATTNPTQLYITAGLQALTSITNTWSSTTNTKAEAQKQAAQIAANASMYNTDKKLGTWAIVGIVFGGIVILGLTTVAVIKFSK